MHTPSSMVSDCFIAQWEVSHASSSVLNSHLSSPLMRRLSLHACPVTFWPPFAALCFGQALFLFNLKTYLLPPFVDQSVKTNCCSMTPMMLQTYSTPPTPAHSCCGLLAMYCFPLDIYGLFQWKSCKLELSLESRFLVLTICLCCSPFVAVLIVPKLLCAVCDDLSSGCRNRRPVC